MRGTPTSICSTSFSPADGAVWSTSAGQETGPDPDKIVVMALRVWGCKQGEVVSLMIHLGDRLGLYRALDGVGR